MMKKVLLGLIAAAAMTGCIKREDSLATDQATNLGSATIKGTVLAKTDYVSDTLANGGGAGLDLGYTGVEGATVIAIWSTSDLDPDGVNGEEMSKTTTTDANGNYSISVDATAEGTSVDIYVDYTGDMSIKHNCFDMGFDNTGTATSTTTTHEFMVDYSYNVTVFKGQTYNRPDWHEEADDATNTCY